MRIHKSFAFVTALALLSAVLPASAETSQGQVTGIALFDANHNGKIDRAVVTFANPSMKIWSVRGSAGISVSYREKALTVNRAFMASGADPASLEIDLDENDPNLPETTAVEGFRIASTPQGAAAGISDGATELSEIPAGMTLTDRAAPVLLSSSPVAGTYDADRDADLALTFSEPVQSDSLLPSSSQNPGSWTYGVQGNRVTVGHAPYGRGVTEAFGIAATDAAGNALVVGSYPNPFTFRTSGSNTPQPQVDTVFTLTAPATLSTLPAGAPAVLAWYSNQAEVTAVRLSYSSDGGISYQTIAAKLPVSQGVYVWVPPTLHASIQLKAEALNDSLTVMNASIVNAVSVSGEAPAVPPPAPNPPPVAPEGFFALKEGDLIKSAAFSAVYWYQGGRRSPFPNETTYRSWFGQDFSKVLTVPADQLASITLGKNVKIKGGTYLVKIQSDPKTYAIEPDGTLRWIQTEAQARALYGSTWNTRVRDVDVSLFSDYAIGAPLQDGERPVGYIS